MERQIDELRRQASASGDAEELHLMAEDPSALLYGKRSMLEVFTAALTLAEELSS